MHEKIVLITRKTALEELVERFNTRDQARFYIGHMGGDFADYEAAHHAYHAAFDLLRESLPEGTRMQVVERAFLPTFTFGPEDLVVTLGPDGLVVNTAKYLRDQPLLAVNPDPTRIDGILNLAPPGLAPWALQNAVAGLLPVQPVSMARAELNDGQTLYAVNDLFIGQRTHVSARYVLRLGDQAEPQSSSGILVSTGAGSTGWFRSVLTGAAGVVESFQEGVDVSPLREEYRFEWGAEYLYFSVREPFISRASAASLVFGRVEAGVPLEVESRMPQNGVIFSDGVEADYLEFNSGAVARISLADRKLRLLGWQ
jgi:hypothetical protein